MAFYTELVSRPRPAAIEQSGGTPHVTAAHMIAGGIDRSTRPADFPKVPRPAPSRRG